MRTAILDTHILVFWRSDPSRLTPAQREHLEAVVAVVLAACHRATSPYR